MRCSTPIGRLRSPQHFRWRAVLNGSALEGGGRGTIILRREANVWKIIHEHLSQFPQRHRSGRLRGSLG
ncbi:nuclear transport factor 2 family protein [Sinorhizobium meliloti]|uniref:SnoaL-like domain-containing protein n=1 Tax=Rhizobium meliloti TaxID=382 RepID=A0AAW9TZY8_RHIML|nr:nuclear transport factor 2 family protein [Sinorhizobium meliloti]MCK3788924.1 nuclear transport factor 2 family protein [Sinorhizobium meliloti]MCK3793801.1 nuclear transport factor 2 family protein [Sinorhizobium meliloti]MCK3801291.1 nuclear transport factor 2 family protein [Sinorhizobium meliloti]MCK3806876.1 nuclear transport factor 2 family protein [Sinorhizobium meliloti]